MAKLTPNTTYTTPNGTLSLLTSLAGIPEVGDDE